MVQKANEQGTPPPLYREGTVAARRPGEEGGVRRGGREGGRRGEGEGGEGEGSAGGHKHQQPSSERYAVREEESRGTAAARKSYGRGRGAGAAAPGVVDPSRGEQRGRDAGLAFACTLTRKLAWLHVVQPIKGHHAIHPRLSGIEAMTCLATPGTGS